MGIMEAKFESAQRTLEAELASQMEKEVSWIIRCKSFEIYTQGQKPLKFPILECC